MATPEVGNTTWLHRVIKLRSPIKGGCRIRCSRALPGKLTTEQNICRETADHFHTFWTAYNRDHASHRGTPLCQMHAERVATAEHVPIVDEDGGLIVCDVHPDDKDAHR